MAGQTGAAATQERPAARSRARTYVTIEADDECPAAGIRFNILNTWLLGAFSH
jgi:hypothetical protein